MKTWFGFSLGLLLGIVLGAFLASFVLFDDVTGGGPAASKIAAVHAPKGAPRHRAPAVSLPPPSIEARPVALPAEAVDLSGLPLTDGTEVISTAKRDEAAAHPSP
jgi:hypothetical protein